MNAIFFEDFATSCIPQILSELYISQVYAPFVKDKSNLVIVDAGANIGLTVQYFAPYAGRLIAIEPHEGHCKCLRRLVQYNELWRVHVVQAALAADYGLATLHEFFGNATMNCLHPGKSGWKEGKEVETVPISYLFEDLNLDRVDLLKLDIEGGEAAVLRSAAFAEYASRIQTIVGEWHSWSGMLPNELKRILTDAGFACRWIHTGNQVQIPTLFCAERNPC